MEIVVSKRGKGKKYGARKYASVPSESGNGDYTVVKVRVWNKRHYAYKCSCPHHMFRQVPCKHILKMQEVEQA